MLHKETAIFAGYLWEMELYFCYDATFANVKEYGEMRGKLIPQKRMYQEMRLPVEFSTSVAPLKSVHSASARRVGQAETLDGQ
jgi:hypothetical protein